MKIVFEGDELTTEILDVCLNTLKLAEKIETVESKRSSFLSRINKFRLRRAHRQMRRISVILFRAAHSSGVTQEVELIKEELNGTSVEIENNTIMNES